MPASPSHLSLPSGQEDYTVTPDLAADDLERSQYWRLPVHHLAFSNSSELLLAELVLYHVAIPVERMFGSSKFAVSQRKLPLSSFALTPLHPFSVILLHFNLDVYDLGIQRTPAV